MSSILQRFLLVILGFVLAVVLAEGLLQLGALALGSSGRMALERGARSAEIRILALGDSNTYGLYLEPDQAYPKVLERIWRSESGEGSLEVVNAGIPGTNSSKLRAEFERLLETFRPDLVTVMIGANDTWTVNVPPEPGGTTKLPFWQHFRLYTLLAVLGSRASGPELEVEFSNPEGLRPNRGKVRYGEQEFFLGWTRKATGGVEGWRGILKENLRAMHRQSQVAGVQLVLITYASEKGPYGRANRVLRSVASQQDLPLVDVRPSFQRTCPQGDCADLYFKTQHPTERGHLLIARALQGHLELELSGRN